MIEAQRVRAFVAVPRDRMWIESTHGLVERLRGELPEASWTKPESWHVTIRFLGDVSRATLDRIAAAIEPLARETVPGELLPGGAVVFPAHGEARVLGGAFADSPALASLTGFARKMDAVVKSFGIEGERRNFHPHVTLARLRRPWPREAVETFRGELAAWSFPAWPIHSCVLYESQLDPAGAVHRPLAQWTLAGGPAGVGA